MFRFPSLQPGNYALMVSAAGFADYKREPLLVEVGRLTSVEANLNITGATVSVDVVADTAAVNTETKEFATNINQTAINELPSTGAWLELALLPPAQPGVNSADRFRGIWAC